MTAILVVEDDPNIRELLQYNFKKEGFEVRTAEDGQKGLEIIESRWPDLVILDLMLPVRDGLEICRIIRSKKELAHMPVIILTAKGEEFDRVLGLEMGADDYVTKPFSTREMIARVKALLRRTQNIEQRDAEVLTRGNLIINAENYEVSLDGEKVELTHKEFQLLYLLASRPGKVFTRAYLLEEIWGYEYLGDSRTVDVHIRHLRQKLGEDLIETVRGVGYRFGEK